jgi:hypothetical protein
MMRKTRIGRWIRPDVNLVNLGLLGPYSVRHLAKHSESRSVGLTSRTSSEVKFSDVR